MLHQTGKNCLINHSKKPCEEFQRFERQNQYSFKKKPRNKCVVMDDSLSSKGQQGHLSGHQWTVPNISSYCSLALLKTQVLSHYLRFLGLLQYSVLSLHCKWRNKPWLVWGLRLRTVEYFCCTTTLLLFFFILRIPSPSWIDKIPYSPS